jgi:hypothetical protein
MRPLILALIAAVPMLGQTCASPTPIQITGPVNALNGAMNGTITLTLNYTVPGNPPVQQSTMQVRVVNGTMYVGNQALVCVPASASVVAAYVVQNPAPLTGTTKFTRFWAIPASGGPYTLYTGVETSTPITPNLTLAWTQLPFVAGANGPFCINYVNGNPVGPIACSGGSGSALFDSVSGLFDSVSGLFDSQ